MSSISLAWAHLLERVDDTNTSTIEGKPVWEKWVSDGTINWERKKEIRKWVNFVKMWRQQWEVDIEMNFKNTVLHGKVKDWEEDRKSGKYVI